MIDDYVRESPALCEVENEWVHTASLACDRTLNILVAAHHTSQTEPKLRAKVLAVYIVLLKLSHTAFMLPCSVPISLATASV